MTYTIAIEDGRANYDELLPNYRRHYAEMQARLAGQGVNIPEYNPRLKQYFQAFDAGYLINYVARFEGRPVGYSNVYLTNDMHNGEFIAQEDTIYVLPEHRNGLGKTLTKFILEDLRQRGVKRASVTALTDLRVAKLWQRLGFKHTAHHMTYIF